MTKQSVLIGILSLITLGLLFYSSFRQLDWDEFEALHTGWKVLFNGTIYKDFFQHHHPFSYYFIALIYKFFGASAGSIHIIRLFIFFLILSIGYATYTLAKLFCNNKIALLSVIFLYSSILFTSNAIEIRPDIFMVFCSTTSVTCWFYYLHSKKIAYLIASSILLSLSFLFLQKAIFIIFFFGILIGVHWLTHRISYKTILLYGAIFSLAPLIYLLYVINLNFLYEYFLLNWIFNLKIPAESPRIAIIYSALEHGLILWFFFAIGIIKGIRSPLWQIIFLALSLNSILLHHTRYLMPALPFTAIVAAYGFSKITINYKSLTTTLLVIITLPVICNYIRTPLIKPLKKTMQKKSITHLQLHKKAIVSLIALFNLMRAQYSFLEMILVISGSMSDISSYTQP
jgi:hypothetical protein